MKYEKIIKQMSLEEKASLMSGKDFWTTQDILKYNIQSIFLADGPNGLRKQKAASDHLGLNESVKSTCFPTLASLANTWNTHLIEQTAQKLGREAAAEKVSVILGPGTNIKRNPLCGRNFEYFSEDPYLSGKLSQAFIKGVQSEGVSACIKHYAVNNQEYRRMSIDSVVDERTLREIYLTPFEIAIKEGKTKSVMSSYNLVNGTYANENVHLLRKILRDEWGFDGVVVTDWGGNNERIKALIAGNDLEMPTTGGETNLDIIGAIKTGNLEERYLDESVNRLLSLIFDTTDSLKDANETYDKELHHEFARMAAEEAIVLLKNEDNILPISRNQKVAVIGDFASKPRFQGAGSSGVNPTRLDNFLSLITKDDFDYLGFESGFKRYGGKSKKLIRKAVKLSSHADVVILFLGLDESRETEGMDRSNLDLAKNQLTLLDAIAKVNSNIVVVLSSGSVVNLNFDSQVKGLLHAYLSGQAGAAAILDILTGRVNPSGKLAETYPFSYDDVPNKNYYPGLQNTAEYRESIYIGYRYYDKKSIKVKYPFGFGLSYTKFKYSNLEVSDKGVSFKVENIGSYQGKEVVQLFVGKKDSQVFRALKELKGFEKVELDVNEEKTVHILFDEYTFRFFNQEANMWQVEAGNYEIYVGSSSLDIRLNGQIYQDGVKVNSLINDLKSYYTGNIENVSDKEFAYLLDREIPNPNFVFYKKRRMKVTSNTTVQQLRYSKGWTGRLFAWAIRFAYKFLRFIGKRESANVIMISLYDMPIRGFSRMTGGAISWEQLEGLIMMFNGRFFKGLVMFIKKKKKKMKRAS